MRLLPLRDDVVIVASWAVHTAHAHVARGRRAATPAEAMYRGEVHDLHGTAREAEHDLVEALMESAQALDRKRRSRLDGAGLEGETVSLINPPR